MMNDFFEEITWTIAFMPMLGLLLGTLALVCLLKSIVFTFSVLKQNTGYLWLIIFWLLQIPTAVIMSVRRPNDGIIIYMLESPVLLIILAFIKRKIKPAEQLNQSL